LKTGKEYDVFSIEFATFCIVILQLPQLVKMAIKRVINLGQ